MLYDETSKNASKTGSLQGTAGGRSFAVGLFDKDMDTAERLFVCVCRDETNSWLDDRLPLAGLWLFLVEVILSKERIQNYSFFLISRKMKPRKK